jgi:hypothetical protein
MRVKAGAGHGLAIDRRACWRMTKPQSFRRLRWLVLGGVVLLAVGEPLALGQGVPVSDWRLIAPAAAEDAKQRPDRPRESEEPKRLPADVTTEHTVELPGRALRFKATAGSIPIMNAPGGKLIAEVAYVA